MIPFTRALTQRHVDFRDSATNAGYARLDVTVIGPAQIAALQSVPAPLRAPASDPRNRGSESSFLLNSWSLLSLSRSVCFRAFGSPWPAYIKSFSPRLLRNNNSCHSHSSPVMNLTLAPAPKTPHLPSLTPANAHHLHRQPPSPSAGVSRIHLDIYVAAYTDASNPSSSERKIDQIESRLGNIESLLKTIASPIAPVDHGRAANTPGTGCSSSIPTTATSTTAADFESSDEEPAFAGDSGLTAQTTFASEFLEKAVRRTSLRKVNPKMEAAFANLRQLVEMQKLRSISHGPRFPLQKPVPAGGVCKLPMPPMSAVVALLKHAKAAPPTLFTVMCALVGLSDFANLCRLVYFATEDFSDATFTIVNAMLYNLFMEQHALATDPMVRDEYHAYMQRCRANLETCLANTPLFLSAKIENVQALVLGALYAIDVSRPSVAWHLSCMGAQLCQAAGYHRSETLKHDPPSVSKLKRILFWHVYTLDKGLGLRLGRAPVINECDIDIPRVFEFDSWGLESCTIPTLWVKISHLQSRIYEQLYSPAALACPQAELVARARVLAEDCRKLEVESEDSREQVYNYLKAVNSSEIVDVFLRGDEVQFQVTLTLVYRVIPAPEGSISRFCDECLEVARKAMQVHQRYAEFTNLGSYFRSIYVHWNLLLTPFAPFFVLFCYVIETSSLEDLGLLQDFVTSLDGSRESSETIDKLYRLTQVMVDVAGLYVEARTQQQDDQTMAPIGDEFEMYLGQLGFMPTEDQTLTDAPSSRGPPGGNGQVAQIADWFSGNRNMMGLLEEDLSHIESYRWMQ